MSRLKRYINLTEYKRFSIAVKNPVNNWRLQIKQTQLVSQASAILLQRHAKFWTPLLKSLNLSSNFTPSLFRQIFDRIETRPQVCLQFFKWVRKNIDFTPDLKTQCRLTRILFDSGLSKLGKPILESYILDHPPAKIAHLLIVSRKGAGFHIVSLLLNSVTESYCSKQMYLQSLQIYQKAVECGVGLTVCNCNSLLSLLVEKNELTVAWCFYASITRNGVSGDQFTWSLIARILCKDGKYERVSMILDMGIYTPVMFSLMIDSCSKRGDFEAAFGYLNKMFGEKMEPSVNTYGSMLDGACKFQDTEVIESVLDLISERGYYLQPRGSDFDLVIQKLCDLGATYAVDLFFKQACDEMIELRHSTYGCMLEALLSEQGRVTDAIKLYNIIREKEIFLSEICYTKFVAVLCQENPSQDISELLIDITRGEFCPATIELSKYISKLCSVGHWREAEELWNLILNQGCLIDSKTCGSLVKYYCCNTRIDLAILLHDKLEGLNVVLDIATYNVFLSALLKEKRTEEAIKVFGYMKACEILSSESFSLMIRGLCHENELRRAMKLHDEMLVLGFKPDRKTYKRLISGFR
ncbi:pentatricopeptide repeat-containing protein-like [Dorcoceras hygrometricum]|uniref:Pentatricopeptide repeat-containing protein-like n=1 Tax=Dorcoceras hygrometricum TaxID=472368 RepID=A0A2Z7D7W7_9LAMI|nr:pentatricopeptide repeat-containing protein-like [Dorcoceras hygrometricum]